MADLLPRSFQYPSCMPKLISGFQALRADNVICAIEHMTLGFCKTLPPEGGSVLLPADTFDVVILQHVAMQISEKELLFGECARVVKPGGCLAMHEIFSGNDEPLTYLLAWAAEPAMSSVESFEQCSERLSPLGFQVGQFVDLSEEGRQFHQRNFEVAEAELAKPESDQERAAEILERRVRASRAIEKNIRIGAIQVGMVVSHKN